MIMSKTLIVGIAILAAYYVFCAIASALPVPTADQYRTFYGFFFRFIQILGTNFHRLAESQAVKTALPGFEGALTAVAAQSVGVVAAQVADAVKLPESPAGGSEVKLMDGLKGTMGAITAAIVISALLLTTTGCSSQQKLTVTQVVQKVDAALPSIIAAATPVAAMIEQLNPADATAIGVKADAFVTLATQAKQLADAYLANPTTSALQQLQTAINTLQQNVSSATLNAVGIKDAESQAKAKLILGGFATLVAIVFGAISTTQTQAQLKALADTHTINMAALRPYLDERRLQRATEDYGRPWYVPAYAAVDQAFQQAVNAGL